MGSKLKKPKTAKKNPEQSQARKTLGRTMLDTYVVGAWYGFDELCEARFVAILKGDTPNELERACFENAMMDMPPQTVPYLADEIGMTAKQITERTIELCEKPPGALW